MILSREREEPAMYSLPMLGGTNTVAKSDSTSEEPLHRSERHPKAVWDFTSHVLSLAQEPRGEQGRPLLKPCGPLLVSHHCHAVQR